MDRLDIVKCTPAAPILPYYVRALALGIPAILLGLQLSGWIGFVPMITHGHFDFRQLYTAGYMLRSHHTHELYDYPTEKLFQDTLISREQIALPFNHLAYEALLFAPLSLLPYREAYFSWLCINVALLAMSFTQLRPWTENLATAHKWLPAAMFVTFLPVAAALMQGQDSVLLLALFAAAVAALDRGQELTAGVLVGLGLFKFQIVLPIALLFLLWRHWRFSAGFALSCAAAGSVSLWLVGFSQAEVYLQSLVSMSVSLASRSDQFRYGISPASMPNLRGLIFGLASARLSTLWLQGLTIVLSSVVLIWVATAPPRNRRGVDGLLLAITTSAALSYHLLIHDLSILLIPIAITLHRFVPAEATGDRVGRLLVRTSAILFVAPICMSFIPNHFFLVALPLLSFLFVLMQSPRPDKQDTVEIAPIRS